MTRTDSRPSARTAELEGIDLIRVLLDELPKTGACLEVARRFALYEEQAPAGVTLDDVFGLTRNAGEKGWWVKEAFSPRNNALRACASYLAPGASIVKQATELSQALKRYQEIHNRHESWWQILQDGYQGSKHEFLWRCFHEGGGKAPTSVSRLQDILSGRA